MWSRHTVSELEARALSHLRDMDLNMIMFDEVHSLLAGRCGEPGRFLNVLRFPASDLRMSLVMIGINDTVDAIRGDDQPAHRHGEHLLRSAGSVRKPCRSRRRKSDRRCGTSPSPPSAMHNLHRLVQTFWQTHLASEIRKINGRRRCQHRYHCLPSRPGFPLQPAFIRIPGAVQENPGCPMRIGPRPGGQGFRTRRPSGFSSFCRS